MRPAAAAIDTRATARVALSASGSGIVTWAEYDGARFHVWARRFERGIGWSAAEQLDPPTPSGTPPLDRTAAGVYYIYPGDAFSPQAYASPRGDLFVTWVEGGGQIPYQTSEIWVSRFSKAAGWSPAGSCPCGQRWGFDDQGHAISVWSVLAHDVTFEIRANRLDPTTGWGTPKAIETTVAQSDPRVAVSGNGRAVSAFEAQSGIEVQSYDPTTDQWTSSFKYADPVYPDIDSVNVGEDGCGNVLLAWDRVEHGADLFVRSRAWWAGYDQGGWSLPRQLTPDGKEAQSPGPLFVMPSGKATLLVQFSSGSPALLTRSSRTNWINRAAPLPLGAGTLLGMTNHGDVLSVGPDSSGVLFAQRNLLETGWDAPVFLEQGAALDMAVLPSGEALLALQDTIQNQLSVALLE